MSSLLYECPGWLAVDKAPGVAVIPARGEDPAESLHKRLEADRGEPLWVVHRLDRDTSGVWVVARTAAAHKAWSTAFSEGQVEKEYLALAQGVPRTLLVKEPLVVDDRGRVSVARPGQSGAGKAKAAQTRIAIVRRWPAHGVCLVRCTPTTGRQHQIRVHLAHVGAPLLCDPLYGASETPWPLHRTALHAERLVAPSSLEGIEVVAPLPSDFVQTIRALDGV